jgi:hypothetical protein
MITEVKGGNMPQQRIHEATARKLSKLSESINKARMAEGLKAKTVPDIIHDIVEEFEFKRNEELTNKE